MLWTHLRLTFGRWISRRQSFLRYWRQDKPFFFDRKKIKNGKLELISKWMDTSILNCFIYLLMNNSFMWQYHVLRWEETNPSLAETLTIFCMLANLPRHGQSGRQHELDLMSQRFGFDDSRSLCCIRVRTLWPQQLLCCQANEHCHGNSKNPS